MKINNDTAAQKIKEYDENKLFSVKFIKRTTGEVRDILCRKGVSLGVTGRGAKYDPDDKNLCCVFDVQKFNADMQGQPESKREDIAKTCYRNINLESIISLKLAGVEYEVNEFPIIGWTIEWASKGVTSKREVLARTDGEAEQAFKRLMNFTRMPRGAKVYATK